MYILTIDLGCFRQFRSCGMSALKNLAVIVLEILALSDWLLYNIEGKGFMREGLPLRIHLGEFWKEIINT